MSDDQFKIFIKRLFAMYPGLHAWLKDNSPDTAETLRSWRRRLSRYTLKECLGVLSQWEQSNREPFAAYQRDQVPSVVASVIAKQRDKSAKLRQQAGQRLEYNRSRDNRSEASKVASAGVMDSEMRRARDLGIPIHKKFKAGEITWDEYVTQRDKMLSEVLTA
jgi:hypothetical protein